MRHCLSRPEQTLDGSEASRQTGASSRREGEAGTGGEDGEGGEGGEDGEDGEGGEGSANDGLATGDAVTGASCLAGERRTRGRVDAATLHGEYAAWLPYAASGSAVAEGEEHEAEGAPYFLVVGSGQQEHNAWQWLRDSGLQARRLLVGGRWRSLVPGT